MKRRLATVFISGLLGLFAAVPALPTQADLEKVAAAMAAQFSTLCPRARPDDVDAHDKCTAGLRHASFIPFASSLLFGGDQPKLQLRKKQLTHFKPSVFQLMYLSLFTYAGRWSVDANAREHVGVILVLLQTPFHASEEIDDVLEMVCSGKIPQDDVGLRKEIAPELRAAILQTGEAFRNALSAADQWEAQQHPADQ